MSGVGTDKSEIFILYFTLALWMLFDGHSLLWFHMKDSGHHILLI